MAYLLGTIFGGFIITTLIALLVGLAFKSKLPSDRAIRSAALSWVICSILAGFGFANGGSFRGDVSLYYVPGAILAFFYLRWHYGKMWREDDEDEDLQRTFE